jgi:hypothetical protein
MWEKILACLQDINHTSASPLQGSDNAICLTDNAVYLTDNAVCLTDNAICLTDNAVCLTDIILFFKICSSPNF